MFVYDKVENKDKNLHNLVMWVSLRKVTDVKCSLFVVLYFGAFYTSGNPLGTKQGELVKIKIPSIIQIIHPPLTPTLSFNTEWKLKWLDCFCELVTCKQVQC